MSQIVVVRKLAWGCLRLSIVVQRLVPLYQVEASVLLVVMCKLVVVVVVIRPSMDGGVLDSELTALVVSSHARVP